MEPRRDMLIDRSIVSLTVRNRIYHSLNDLVIKECSHRLPVPFMYFIEGELDKRMLKFWLDVEKSGIIEIYEGD